MKKKDVILKKREAGELRVPQICLGIFAVYCVLIAAFYGLAGEQLHLRQSRGEFALPGAEAGTVELVQGAVVEQTFSVKIQRLQALRVQWGTYYRPNAGTVTMELWDTTGETRLFAQSFDAATIAEGGLTALEFETPLEGYYDVPLTLRIYADSQPGSAVSPLMAYTFPEQTSAKYPAQAKDFHLTLNGEAREGVLCLSISGEDYIWTGLHYWQFAAAGGGLLALALLFLARRWAAGKHSYVIYALIAVKKYRFLIRQLVGRDFKTKYKRSVLGVFWSFLNPLLTMLVQYFVFSTIFKSDIPYFAAYLIIGTVMFNFFSEATGMALGSIVGNASLITKVYMPKYIYPLTRVMSSVVNLAISLIPLLMVCVCTGVQFRRSAVLALYFFACLMLFSLGLGLLLSAAMVFFRDTQFLWGVVTMMWMYATPIFYPETILPENLQFLLKLNPLYYFLKNARLCILDGLSPEPAVYVQCLLIGLGALLLGALVFRRTQDKFVLYL